MCFFVKAFLNISIGSEGNDDPGKTASGVAYIFVNGKDYSPQGRGHNVVTVDAETGKGVLLNYYYQIIVKVYLNSTFLMRLRC